MSRRRLALLAALTLASAALVPTAALGGARAAAKHTVTLKNFRFHPGSLTINRGDTVTWAWHDGGENEHNVTFHGFHSRTQTSGSYTVRFTRTGTFAYRCTIHASEGMRGKITVR
jgi:plastocyanin